MGGTRVVTFGAWNLVEEFEDNNGLRYSRWVERQGKTAQELERQWDEPGYWTQVQALADLIDETSVSSRTIWA